MTFAEYNTDTNFDNDKSSLDELVKIGVDEGKSEDEIRNTLSAKWKNSKKINELSSYYQKHSANKKKEETPKEEEKVTEKVTETAPVQTSTPTVSKADEKYINAQNGRIDKAQQEEINRLVKQKTDDFNSTMETNEKAGEAYRKINDRMIENLPRGIIQAYKDNEFGDISTPEGKKAAKQRMGYFLVDNFNSILKNFSNAAANNAGRANDFADTESAYSKYQKTNLEQGLENRWNKYKQETNNAVALVANRSMTEEEALDTVNKISQNQRLQNVFNMVDENQKAYMLEVLSKLGDEVGNWNDKKFVNALYGGTMTGKYDATQLAEMLGARAGVGVVENLNLFDENGNIDLSSLKELIKIPGLKDALKDNYGIDLDNVDFSTAGIGGGGSSSSGDDAPASGVKLSDGTVIDPGKMLSMNDFSVINKTATDLSDKYYRGEISEEQFREDYNKLYNVVQQHNIMNKITGTLVPVDKRVKQLKQDRVDYWDRQIDDLNSQAKNGLIKTSDYAEKFAELEKSLVSAGGDAKKTAKKKLSTEDILKAVDKINKTKSKKK